MAHALHNDFSDKLERMSNAAEKMLDSRAAMAGLVVVLVAALLFFGWVVRGLLSADCYADMRTTGLERETVELFDDVGATMTGLRKGTGRTEKWNDAEFQDRIKGIQGILADGRQALKDQDGFAALGTIVDVQKAIAQAKAQATDRVNFIIRTQDPSDYNAFEKYRLEGKNLVAIVKELDGALQTLDDRTKKLPKSCNW